MRLTSPAVLAVLVTVLLSPAAVGPSVARADDGAHTADADRYLPRSMHGRAAFGALDEAGRLDDVARRNEMSVARLERLLADESVWVTRSGDIYYADPVPAATEEPAPVARGPFPQSETFTLHSKAGSQRTLFIDFNGEFVGDTSWNTSRGGDLADGSHPGWDPAGDGAGTWSAVEHDLVQSIWQRVAEDFAPFDVDVTTQDPGAAAITRSNTADLQYGTRALVTPSDQALTALCNGNCVGIAFLDVFDAPTEHRTKQPAWIFPQSYGQNAKGIAETISHEVGHNFDLEHDSKGSTEYYEGHANWAPIMGNSDLEPITQWSSGSYSGSTQTQDDLALIAARTRGLRSDEAGATVSTAALTHSPRTAGFVTSRTDLDVYALGTCAGAMTVTASVATVSPNLDVRLRILDAAGAQVASANPSSGQTDEDQATGLSASISTTVSSGDYFAEVDGVGSGNPTTGYDDYASLGAYTLTTSGCADAEIPSAPRDLTARASGDDGAVVTWAAPLHDGGSAITGYRVAVDGGTPSELGPAARTVTLTGLTAGTHTVSVRALNANGPGTAAQTTVTTGTPLAAPGAVRSLAAVVTGTRADITWQAPASDGGSAITGYQVEIPGVVDPVVFDATTTDVFITDLPRGRTYSVRVEARNAVGPGPVASVTFSVPATAPGAARIGTASSGAAGGAVTALARWRPPVDDGGAAINGYRIHAYEQGGRRRTFSSRVLAASLRSASFGLPAGRYRFAVRARNSVGWGPLSPRSGIVVAR